MQYEDGDVYKTSDLGLTALLSLQFSILGKEKVDGNRVVFSFAKTKELEAYVSDYYNGNLRINPLTFQGQMKVIKHMIYG